MSSIKEIGKSTIYQYKNDEKSLDIKKMVDS